MKRFIAATLFLTLASFSLPVSVQNKVYICVSSYATVYHQDRDCRGLGSCKHTIKSVTEREAIDDYGRRRCKVCY